MDSFLAAILLQAVNWLLALFIPSKCARYRQQPNNTLKSLPIVSPGVRDSDGRFFSNYYSRSNFIMFSKPIIALAKTLYPNDAARIATDNGEVVMLPWHFADEIRNHPHMSFSLAIREDNHAHIPGFEVVDIVSRKDQILQTVVRKQLTKHLTAVIEPLSKETKYALDLSLGIDHDWREIHLKSAMLDIIARMSSRIYLGEEMCRNNAWLRATKSYTTAFFDASVRLRHFPKPLRPVLHWILPECRRLRRGLADSRRIIGPFIKQRLVRKHQALESDDEEIITPDDSLEWADEVAASTGSTYDPAAFQLTLSLLAIHTTFDLLQQCILDLARNPQFVQPLRDEISQVLARTGWKKTAFHEMRLLDSAIKESQRLKPGSLASMRRYVSKDTTLSNGLFLPTGSRLNVDSSRMVDPALHASPESYDAGRFLRMRAQPGREYMAQLIATSVDHLGFGHGQHSCPGRFFASNEIKVALCHILVKYDWRMGKGSVSEPIVRGMVAKSSPHARIDVRRRRADEMEIELDVI